MDKSKKRLKKTGASDDKPFLDRMWSTAAPYALLMVVCLAVPLVILLIKSRVSDNELKAALGRKANPSFSLVPKVPTAGKSIKIVAAKSGSEEAAYSYNWWLNGISVEGHNKDIFPGAGLKRGDEIRVAVLDKNGAVISTRAVEVANQVPSVKSIKFEPLPLDIKHDLKVSAQAEDMDDDLIAFEYAWLVNEEPVIGETEPVLSCENFTRGDKVRVKITVSDGQSMRQVLSAPILVMNSPPEIVSKPPAMISQGTYTYHVEARDSEGDALKFSLGGNPPPGMNINPEIGLVTWNARMPEKPVSYAYQVIVKDDFHGRCVQNIFLEFK